MLNFLKRLPIRRQLIVLSACSGTIMLIIILIIYVQVADVLKKNNTQYTSEMFQQIKQSISANCNFMERMLSSTSYNNVVQNYIMEGDYIKGVSIFKDIDSLFSNMQDIREGIIDFVIIADDGKEYFLKGKKDSVRQILSELPGKITNYYTPCVSIEYSSNTAENCFIIASTVYSVSHGKEYGNKIGMAAIVVDAKSFGLEMGGKFKEAATKFYLLDKENNIYSSNDNNLNEDTAYLIKMISSDEKGSNSIKYKGEKYIVNMDFVLPTGGKIVSIVTEKRLFSELFRIRRVMTTLFLIMLVLLSIPFTIITNNILSPLNKLVGFMENVRSGNLKGLKERINLIGYSEIEVMAGAFNNMLDEIDSLTHRLINTSSRLYELELEKKKAELGYLKSQINPHFLYNTLESMKGTAADEEAPGVFEMARALGAIFRYSVKGADMVGLNEELEIVKSYIHIQQIRFVNRFEVHYQLDDAAIKCPIPKMILQPIVENAIYHGLETKMEKGNLWIGAGIDKKNDLHLWVKDDGTGMEMDTLQQLKDCLQDMTDASKGELSENSGIGIINVNNRIVLTYGKEYGIHIDSKPNKGTEVSIKIPAGGCKNA